MKSAIATLVGLLLLFVAKEAFSGGMTKAITVNPPSKITSAAFMTVIATNTATTVTATGTS